MVKLLDIMKRAAHDEAIRNSSGDFPHALVTRGALLLQIVTNLHLPRLLMARYLFGQPHY